MGFWNDLLSTAGAVASILGFAAGFFVGRPFWVRRVRIAQEQKQRSSEDRAQSQKQEISL